MRPLSIILFALFSFIQLSAQELNYGFSIGDTPGDELGYRITVDAVGNTIVMGTFRGICDFDPSAAVTTLTNIGNEDVFIVKYDPAGSLLWAKQLEVSTKWLHGLITDSSGNIIICGSAGQGFDLDPGPGVVLASVPNGGAWDWFCAKYDPSGNLIWGWGVGGSGFDWCRGVALDDQGNVYLTGTFKNTVDFDPGSGVANLTASSVLGDMCIAKYDANGDYQWAIRVGSAWGEGIAIGSNNTIYATGRFSSQTHFDPALSINDYSPIGGADVYVANYDLNGNFLWANQMGGTYNNYGKFIGLDAADNIYISGYMADMVDFDPGSGVAALSSTSITDLDVYVAKYDASGNYNWAHRFGGTGADEVFDMEVSPAGDVYLTGTFEGTASWSSGVTGPLLISNGDKDAFAMKWNSAGELERALSIGGPGEENGSGVGTDADGNILLTGGFEQTIDVDQGIGTTNLVSAGGNDIFILSYAGDTPTSIVRGNVYADLDSNCVAGGSDFALAQTLVKATPGPHYALTDSMGNYALVLDSGTYTVELAFLTPLESVFEVNCPAGPGTYTISVDSSVVDTGGFDFAAVALPCPFLGVTNTFASRRACFPNTNTIQYCNYGIVASDSAWIVVELPDESHLLSAGLAYTINSDSNYVFSLGVLPPGTCGSFTFVDSIECDVELLNHTICTAVSIYPANDCAYSNDSASVATWDGSDIHVEGECLLDSLLRFTVHNQGDSAMADSSDYFLYANDALVASRRFTLGAGESTQWQFAGDGRTFRLEADQRPGHPNETFSMDVLEGCGSTVTGLFDLGYVNTRPMDDEPAEEEITCGVITGSFDPNAKSVSPTGFTANHYVLPDTRLSYLLQFQNTGTDTAFTVVLIDTLSALLDLATIEFGGSSHPYTAAITGAGVLEFTFANILLPDSNANEAGSHGFVQFAINPMTALPNNTYLENFTDIYFDFNPPVRTDTAWVTIFDSIPTATAPKILLCDTTSAPAIALSATDSAFCDGEQTSIMVTGGSAYIWDGPAMTGTNSTSPTIQPTASASYQVLVGDSSSCFTTIDSIAIVVNPLPDVSVADAVRCIGDSISLGVQTTATQFSWSPTTGVSDSTIANPLFYPPSTTVYSVVGTDTATGCVNSDVVTLIVAPPPVVDAGANTGVCTGSGVTLSATGPALVWQADPALDNLNTPTPIATPATDRWFKVVGTSSSGCVSIDSVFVSVNALPTVNAGVGDTVCEGTSAFLAATGPGLQWETDPALSSTSIPNPIAAPLVDTWFTVVATDTNGCINTDSVFVAVWAKPAMDAGASQSVCLGSSAQLLATGPGISWQMNPALDNPAISNPIAMPVTATWFVVVATDSNGCISSDSVLIEVNQLPIVAATVTEDSICLGDQTALDATGLVQGMWSPANDLADSAVAATTGTPQQSGWITFAGLDTNGCAGSDSVYVQVNALPTVSISSDSSAFCPGDSLLLVATGADSYWWAADSSLSDITSDSTWAAPIGDITYTVTGVFDNTQCSDTSSTSIQVISEQPEAAFTFSVNQVTVTFTDSSTNATSWTWLVGGDSIGTGQSIVYTADADAEVYACVVASNACLADTFCMLVFPGGIFNAQQPLSTVRVWPNPNAGTFTVDVSQAPGATSVRLTDLRGRTVLQQRLAGQAGVVLSAGNIASGFYLLEVYDGVNRIATQHVGISR